MSDRIVINPASVQRVDLTPGGSPTVDLTLPPAIKCVIGEVATTISVGLVPLGGAAGDVLTKIGTSDYAVGWQVPTGGSGGTSLLYDISFPDDPETGTWFVFSADVVSGLAWKDVDGTTDLTAANEGDAARYDGSVWVKVGSFADQTIPDAYSLPDATESVKGGVKGATSSQAAAASGTTILAWTHNRIQQVIAGALPSGSTSEAQGTTNVRRVWTPAKLREAANAAIRLLVPAVFRSGDNSLIPTDKLGSGVRSGSTYLKGDGSFGEGPTPAAGGPLDSVALTKVGNTISVSGSSTAGPAFSDLSSVIWLSFNYDRVNADIEFNTLVLKSEIEGVTVGNAKKLQLQGGGGGYGNLYDVGGNLTFGVFDAQYANVTCRVYKLTGAADGISRTDADDRYLQLSGGALTGLVTLSGAPTADLHPATKKYVDDLVASSGSGGESYDDTALRADVDAIESNLDALDAPLALGAFVNATADDLAAGFGCFVSDNTGRYSDSDFVVTGNVQTPTTAARMYVRVPKHRSRHGIKIRVGSRAYPDDDPATGEYLVPVEKDVIGQMQNPPLFSGEASAIADYFFIGFVSDDEATEYLNFSGTYQLQIAPIVYPDYLTIYYWQDGTAAPRTAAGHAVSISGRTGELLPVIFPAKARPRNLHFLVPNKWEVSDIIIGGDSAFGDFKSRAFNTVSTVYDSARIRSQGEVTCLIWLKEA